MLWLPLPAVGFPLSSFSFSPFLSPSLSSAALGVNLMKFKWKIPAFIY